MSHQRHITPGQSLFCGLIAIAHTLGFLDAPAITEGGPRADPASELPTWWVEAGEIGGEAVEQAAALRSRAPAACEPRRRPSAVETWAARRKRVHAGGRTHTHPGSDPAP